MRTLLWLNGIVSLAFMVAVMGCGETNPTGSGGSGGSGGTGGTGGAGNTGGTGGTMTGGGGTGGTGGAMTGGGGTGGTPMPCTPGDLSTCQAGEYCNSDSNTCVSCSDLSTFRVGTPKALNVQVPNDAPAWFPRVNKDGTLYFSLRPGNGMDNIAYAPPDMSDPHFTWGMVTAEPMPINLTTSKDNAPFYLEDGQALLGNIVDATIDKTKPTVFLTSDRLGLFKVLAYNEGQVSYTVTKLPGTGNSLSQIAFATGVNPARLWYMSNEGGTQGLVTAESGTTTASSVPLPAGNNCVFTPSNLGFAPWVTPDGKWLVFHAIQPNMDCTTTFSNTLQLYALALQPDGTPVAGQDAKPIFPGETNNYQTPSLSPDMCVLYFTHVDNTAMPATMTMMGAVRE